MKKTLIAFATVVAIIAVVSMLARKALIPSEDTVGGDLSDASAGPSEAVKGRGSEAGMEFANDPKSLDRIIEMSNILKRMANGSAAAEDQARLRELERALYPDLPEGAIAKWLSEQTPKGRSKRDAEKAVYYLSSMESHARYIESWEKRLGWAENDAQSASESGSDALTASAQKQLLAAQKILDAEKKVLDAVSQQLAALLEKDQIAPTAAERAALKNRSLAFAEWRDARDEYRGTQAEHLAVKDVVDAQGRLQRAVLAEASAGSEAERAAAAQAMSAAQALLSHTETRLAGVIDGSVQKESLEENYRAIDKDTELTMALNRAFFDLSMVRKAHGAERPGGSQGGADMPHRSSSSSLSSGFERLAEDFRSKTGKAYKLPPSSTPSGVGASSDSSGRYLNAMIGMAKEYEQSGYAEEAQAAYQQMREYFSQKEIKDALRRFEEKERKRR